MRNWKELKSFSTSALRDARGGGSDLLQTAASALRLGDARGGGFDALQTAASALRLEGRA